MNVIIVILIIIIFMLISYLLILKKELKRVNKNLDDIWNLDTNQVLHVEYTSKELKELILKINTMLNYIREKELNIEHKNKLLKREITNITHDLRTPLTSSLGYIDLIQKSNISKEEQIRELKIVESRLLRLEELINSFFEYSIITTENNKIKIEQINLVGVIEQCISHYYDDFSKQNRVIQFENESKNCLIQSNEEMLKRVLDNLIGNSLKHSNSDLVISLLNENDRIKLGFKNKINSNNLDVEHIFDEFYTADISRTKGNTGLGLAIVKEYTELLGGKIKAQKIKEDLIIEIIIPKGEANT